MKSAPVGISKGTRAAVSVRFARTIRCATVGSATRNARAISSVVSPPSRRRVSATRASRESTGWQEMKTSRSTSSSTTSSSAAAQSGSSASSSSRPSSAVLRSSRSLRRKTSIARCLAVAISQAPGLAGTPVSGHRSSAATSASCASSSARPTSPVTRVSAAMSFADSMRQTASTTRETSAVIDAVRAGSRRASRPALGLGGGAQPVLLLAQLGGHRVAEVVGGGDLPDLDLAVAERRLLDPLERPPRGRTPRGSRSRPPVPWSRRTARRRRCELPSLSNRTRAPFELGSRPSPASITPAFTSSSLYAPISASSCSVGSTPFSRVLVALDDHHEAHRWSPSRVGNGGRPSGRLGPALRTRRTSLARIDTTPQDLSAEPRHRHVREPPRRSGEPSPGTPADPSMESRTSPDRVGDMPAGTRSADPGPGRIAAEPGRTRRPATSSGREEPQVRGAQGTRSSGRAGARHVDMSTRRPVATCRRTPGQAGAAE